MPTVAQVKATLSHAFQERYPKTNGAISFVSSAFVVSISDVELTETSGLLNHLRGKSDISVMADRDFIIRDKGHRCGPQHSFFFWREDHNFQ